MLMAADQAANRVAKPRMGVITSYDPNHYTANVKLMPDGIDTGWIPIGTDWIGEYNPPNIGDVVEVNFQQGGKEAGYIGKRFYSNKTPPIPVQSGERWIVHKSGSFIKFTNDGDIIISAARDLINHAGRNYLFDANGQGQKWNGSSVETWQDNDTTGAHHNHAPPQIPD
jgi:hypothetical protein